MNTLICFVSPKNNNALSAQLEPYKQQGHSYVIVNEPNLSVPFIPNIVFKNIKPKNMKDIFFLTDNENLLKIIRNIYSQFFKGFIFFESGNEQKQNFELEEDIYKALINYQPDNLNPIIHLSSENAMEMFTKTPAMSSTAITKLFYYKGLYYIFEPFGKNNKVIFIDENEKADFKPLSAHNFVLCGFEQAYIIKGMNDIISQIFDSDGYFSKSFNSFWLSSSDEKKIRIDIQEFFIKISNSGLFEQLFFFKFIEILEDVYGDYVKIFLASINLLNSNPDIQSATLEQIIQIARQGSLAPFEKYYLYDQVGGQTFSNPNLRLKNENELKNIYQEVYEYAKGKMLDNLSFIPRDGRNKNRVVVITSQFLGLWHGPTKTALDRVIILQRHGMDVFLLNTKEMFAPNGKVPFFNGITPNILTQYDTATSISYEEFQIPFAQINCAMPSLDGIEEVLRYIRTKKPYYIISIGNSLIADLCSNIVPVIHVSTVPSSFHIGYPQFLALGRKMTKDEQDILVREKRNIDSVIEIPFSFALKKQTKTFSRKELNLPENKFIILVVGGRLTSEISEDFIQMLLKTVDYNTHFVFMGNFATYPQFCDKFPVFKDNSSFLGMVGEVLAVNELCNLYCNPKRAGGGTSVVEAMFKKLPCVSLNSGDVSYNAGEEFCVPNYEAMAEKIKQYATNEQYYQEMSEKAKKRADYLLDSDTLFMEIIEKVTTSSLFK